ncbi:dihydrodipicolinate synthase family protein [Carnobacterium gallinarum]|uniref:dihydrodipicolinate synthase family protein n=1 Tax=Carnobacterium gallinarum TaxID=2749 RepID=UPI000AE2F9AE|nr:dihydrodipicolinate synthase family protein [Carnobacterium gallinarum]
MYDLKNDYHIAVPTAFYNDEILNITDTLEHIIYLQNHGIHSVLVCGSTGEQHSLTVDEKIALLTALETETRLHPDFEIIFGVASIRQKEAILLAESIHSSTKISGILLGFPPYILPSQKEAMSYVNTLSNILGKPIILYNNPKRIGFNLATDSLIELAKNPAIIGIKEAGERNRIPDVLSFISRKFSVYAGGEIELKEKIHLGFTRLSSIAGNLYPQEVEQWFNALRNGSNGEFSKQAELDQLFKDCPLTN